MWDKYVRLVLRHLNTACKKYVMRMSGIWMSVKEIPSVSFSSFEKLSLENVTTLIGRRSNLCRSLLYCS